MTINVAVVTSESLVLGCDSIASVTEYLVDPFSCEDSSEGGAWKIKITPADIVQRVTNTWDGVTKMFSLQAGSCSVAAVTAGLAKLCDRSIGSYANEFFSKHGGGQPVETLTTGTLLAVSGTMTFPSTYVQTVEGVASEFLQFMRQHYDAHYANSTLPEEYRDGPVFLVGGYDSGSHLPSLYRLNVQENRLTNDYPTGEFGIAWAGQADAVERVVRGYDTHLKVRIENEIRGALDHIRRAQGEATARIMQELLDKLGQALPDGYTWELPASPEVKLPWDRFATRILYGELPLQDAVDFAAYVVGLQSGKAKFAFGVPTVGGRTHIGVITKAHGFRMLGEPELKHTNVGYT